MNQVLDAAFFIFRYIPFWSIPLFMICLQFGYIFWVKEIRFIAFGFYGVSFLCVIFLFFYIYAGSPDGSARLLDDIIRNLNQ